MAGIKLVIRCCSAGELGNGHGILGYCHNRRRCCRQHLAAGAYEDEDEDEDNDDHDHDHDHDDDGDDAQR